MSSPVQQETRRRGRPGSGQSESIQSLVKALAILDCLAHSNDPVGVTEVANHIGIPKATAHRLLATLHANDAVSYNADSQRYSLGSSIIRFGLMGLQRLSLHRVARPHLERLQRETGETAVLAIRQSNNKVFLDQIESREEIRHQATLGRQLSLYHGGSGQAILAFMEPDELDEYLSHGPFPAMAPGVITDPDELRVALVQARRQGYAISRSERTTSIGAPILDHTGKVLGAIGVFAPTFRVSDERADLFSRATLEAGASVSRELGYAA